MTQARILVVDDSRSVVRILELILQKEGFEVLTAFDGLQGLETARAAKPDLIILDIVMPRLDGYEVCRLLRSDPDTADVPIVMLSVKGQVRDPSADEWELKARVQERVAGLEAGATDFLSKPIRAKELLDWVKNLLWLEGFPVMEQPEIG